MSLEVILTLLLLLEHAQKNFGMLDHSLPSYFGMEGLIDLRVADMLAKQAALQHKAAVYQAQIAEDQASQSGSNTAVADWASMTKGASKLQPWRMTSKLPHHATWYQPSAVSSLHKGKYLPSIRDPDELRAPLKAMNRMGRTVKQMEIVSDPVAFVFSTSRVRRDLLNSFI